MSKNTQDQAALKFQKDWNGSGYEKGESQKFWIDLLTHLYGVTDIKGFIEFEKQVKLSHTSFIDGYIPSTKVMIEQKGSHIDLNKAYTQSDGQSLTPFQQAKRYADELPYDEKPRWIVVSNFREWHIHDMNIPSGKPEVVLLENLHKEYHRLAFLVNKNNEHVTREMEVSVKAGKIIGDIYDRLLAQYADPNDPATLHSLNVLCVRLVFCLYAEDAGIFAKQQFGDYIKAVPAHQLRRALLNLFEVLDTPIDQRDPYLEPELAAFDYVNGGLFTLQDKSIPQFTDELRDLLLGKASDNFDWSDISPTIFGAIFESTLNPETRRSGGMHYTSIENIHKVIDPLFLNDLRKDLDTILAIPQEKRRNQALRDYQQRLGSLRFLDPACGSGNFLTETFLSLRRLENECIQALLGNQSALDFFDDRVLVNIHQFYGIEINDFAATVAKTALWIAESQMLNETSKILARDLDFLPLKSYDNIVEGNALTIDWNTVCPASELSSIIGNPPFVGARWMSKEQKEDVLNIFGKKWEGVGDLDYVCCWYKKAVDLLQGTKIRAALVSTNSITQGGAVANLWKPLFENYNIQIDFAWRTFRWDSEASIKAHVHCVIIGFSDKTSAIPKKKVLYASEEVYAEVQNINGYLLDAANTFVLKNKKPICGTPEMGMGNQPIDGGYYLFDEEEMDIFVKSEPQSASYFHPFYGAYEFINRKPRYCLWLGDCSPSELRKMPNCLKRVEAVRNSRLSSNRSSTLKLADTPTRFQTENFPQTDYIVVPEVSSEKRRYIPIGMMTPDDICSNKLRLMPDATLSHFGILTSNVHMAWMRAVCGRLEMRYSYSIDIVYNNFPWPAITPEQEAEISRTAQAILDARNLYPDSSLAALYDESTMPIELRRAHQANDKAVMKAYGLPVTTSESDTVAHLFKLYEQLTNT